MLKLHQWFEHIWWQQPTPPLWLRCIEPIYAAISQAHLNHRATKVVTPPLPMISVGNITAGGSGKTPFVLWLADQLKQQGYAPVILCRGDGGSNTSPIIIGENDTASMVGDEAKMLADLSGCPVIAAADRIAGSQMAEELGNILILDDGFQYRHLERCCDIVLIPMEGVGNGHHIPAGPLREPITSLTRADIIIRTGSASNTELCQPLSNQTEWQWRTEAVEIIDIMNSGAAKPDNVYAVTAIARPQRFFDDLQATGLYLSGSKAYPDHYSFDKKNITEILRLHSNIAITAKDAVKMIPLWPKGQPLWLLQQRGTAEPDLLDTIQSYINNTRES